jgi:hypothetical protein
LLMALPKTIWMRLLRRDARISLAHGWRITCQAVSARPGRLLNSA